MTVIASACPPKSCRLVERVARVGVDGVADASNARGGGGDLLGTRSGDAGGVGTAEVVAVDGVVPEGLDGSVIVVGTL